MTAPVECPCVRWAYPDARACAWSVETHHPACDGTGHRKDDPGRLVCVVTPTVQDGTVLRWYANLGAAERSEELASASRNRLELVAERIPDALRARVTDSVWAAHRELAHDADADVRHYATHEHRGAFGGPLVPVGGGAR